MREPVFVCSRRCHQAQGVRSPGQSFSARKGVRTVLMSEHRARIPRRWRVPPTLAILLGLGWVLVVISAPLLPGAKWLGYHTPTWIVTVFLVVVILALVALAMASYLLRRRLLRRGVQSWFIGAAVAALSVGLPLGEIWMHYRLPAAVEYLFQGAIFLYILLMSLRRGRGRDVESA